MRQRHAQSQYLNKKEDIPERSHQPKGNWDLLQVNIADTNNDMHQQV